jgi:hypothetical protein
MDVPWSGITGTPNPAAASAAGPCPAEAPRAGSLGLVSGTLVLLVFATLPVYLLPSGSPQVVDLFIVPLMLIMACRINPRGLVVLQELGYLLPFLSYAVCLNAVYFVANPHDPAYLKKAGEMLYVSAIILVFSQVFARLLGQRSLALFLTGLTLSAVTPFFIQGTHDQHWIRTTLSFNNPNQMGYFAIILLSYLLLTREHLIVPGRAGVSKFLGFLIWLTAALAHIMVLLSLSKTALACLLILDLQLFRRTPLKVALPTLGGAALLLFLVLAVRPSYYANFADYLRAKANLERVEERLYKNYARLDFAEEWQWVLGAGGGKAAGVMDDTEVHHIFGAILKTYGLVGVGLAGLWFGRLLWLSRSLKNGPAVSLALILYNSFHNGIRFRPFWIFCAFLVVLAVHRPSRGTARQPQPEPFPGRTLS